MTNALSQSKKNSFRRRAIELTVTMHLEKFDYYVSRMSADLQGEKQQIEERLSEMSAGLPQEEAAFLDYEFSDEFYLIDNVFLPLFLHSSTISLFAFFESELTGLCKRLDRSRGQGSAWSTLGGAGIEKAKAYLKGYRDVSFGKLNPYWENLNNMQSIRNCLAHANGDINQMSNSTKKQKIRHIVSSTNGLSIVDDNQLNIENRYLQERSADVRAFLLALSELLYP